MILGLFKVIRHLQLFEFETRKKLLNVFKLLAKVKDCSCKNELLASFAAHADVKALVLDLLALLAHNDDVIGCAGQLVKIFAKAKETYKIFTDCKVFYSLFLLAANHNLQIASECQEALEVTPLLTVRL